MPLFTTANKEGVYRKNHDKEHVINYILSESKAISGLCGAFGVVAENIAHSMDVVSAQFGKTKGIQLRHFILSFHPKETQDKLLVAEIGYKFAQYLSREFQTVYALHEDKPHLHVHFVINSVSFIDGHRYYGTRKEFYMVMNFLKYLLNEYGFEKPIYVSNSSKNMSLLHN